MKTTIVQNKRMLAAFFILFIGVLQANAQSTFSQVYSLLQSNCSNCHGGSTPIAFSVDGSQTDFYNAIVNIVPQNEAAAAKGEKLIYPGHPYKSFLLKKIGSSFDNYLALGDEEGSLCPQSTQNALADADIELVRQWIIRGALQTGVAVDYQVLVDYYTNGGLPFIPVPEAPDPSEGFQIRYGPLFLKPQEEREFLKKEHVGNTSLMKVWRMDGKMSTQSHHMLLYKRDDGGSGAREGTRLVPGESVPFLNMALTGAWQDDLDYVLPNPTALHWEPNTILDFDYHIKNYSSTQILPNDFYLNVYLDNNNTRNVTMHVALVNDFALLLFQGIQTRTNTAGFTEERYIHSLTSHTHKYGIDFDIYVNNNGAKGEQLYEGFFNTEYTFNQGYYDWEHPSTRYFEPLKKVSSGGLIYETKWNVQQPIVTFGPTTNDEMMLFYYTYTTEPLPELTGIRADTEGLEFVVAPNPFSNNMKVSYALSKSAEVEMSFTNTIGQQAQVVAREMKKAGSHQEQINFPQQLPAGIYMLHLRIDGQQAGSKKVVKME